ncbi:Nucleolar GTP-binding protein 2 [Babesia sp. Xinjiang]|uniref:Nucleolar GTP-binding protein 2 n=1 Tax=Babesia sp. Xinjiang TaxID=462227 RepID=UPI000A216DBD|nr:Nucleolar GTP-binding protein 2 [Babesia sp. Xinjiang]ORM40456.1 Nucleolar GTP-binding protein 2 [Babesia sp. Xinjiang]
MAKVRKNRIAKRSAAQPFPAFRASTAITNPHRTGVKGKKEGQYRDKATIKRLNMYRDKPNLEKMRQQATEPVRICPDRRWFGNTRVLTQEQMTNMLTELEEASSNPRTHILKRSKLPISLIKNSDQKEDNSKILALEPFEQTFGSKSVRKRPKLLASTVEELAERAASFSYDASKDTYLQREMTEDASEEAPHFVFKKGTSKRIWGELYKVIDCSDVIVQVIDARNPMGTRCHRLEKYIRDNKQSKALVLVLNKCDLVPTWVTAAWIKHLNRTLPTVAFHASVTNPFGKNTLIQLLKQYSQLMKDRKHFSVGFIGYPNVGKSSVINTLKGEKNCKAAPIPGETRVWQYVSLTKRIHLIDCPGVTPIEDSDEADRLLKGVVRVERISDPENYIGRVLEVISRDVLVQRYGISPDFDNENFLDLVAVKFGKFQKGRVPDVSTAARIVLYDFQRGRLPYYSEPPPADTKVDPGAEIKDQIEELGRLQLGTEHAEPISEEQVESVVEGEVASPENEVAEAVAEKKHHARAHAAPSQLAGIDYNSFLCASAFTTRPSSTIPGISPFIRRSVVAFANPGTVERISNIVATKFEREVKDIDPDCHFLKEFKADNLDEVELLLSIEEEFDLTIPDYDFEELHTVNDIANYVDRKLERKN